MSRFHFHRVFKAITGVTPKAYAAAHRARRVRDELARSDTVTDAIYGAGFNSSGRFYAAAAGRARHDADELPVRRRGRVDPLRRRRVLAGLDPRRRDRPGRLRDPARRRPGRAGARSSGPLPEGPADRRRRRASSSSWPGSSASSRRRRSASICRSTSAAPPSSSGSGRRCARSRPARRRPTRRSPGASARRRPCGPSRRRARRTRSPSRSPAIAWCGTTGRSSGYRWGVERKRALLDREAAT